MRQGPESDSSVDHSTDTPTCTRGLDSRLGTTPHSPPARPAAPWKSNSPRLSTSNRTCLQTGLPSTSPPRPSIIITTAAPHSSPTSAALRTPSLATGPPPPVRKRTKNSTGLALDLPVLTLRSITIILDKRFLALRRRRRSVHPRKTRGRTRSRLGNRRRQEIPTSTMVS